MEVSWVSNWVLELEIEVAWSSLTYRYHMDITTPRRKSKYPPIPVNNSKEILRKHHTLVETLRSETSIQSLRFINSCIYGHCQGNRFDPSRFYLVNLHDYQEKSGLLTLEEAFQEVKQLAVSHLEKTIVMAPTPDEVNYFHLIDAVDIVDQLKEVYIRWNPYSVALVSGKLPKGQYEEYDNRMGKTSSYRNYLLYELIQTKLYLLDRFKHKEFILPTEELRLVTGCLEIYTEFKFFNSRVIQPTIRDMANFTGIRLVAKGNKTQVKFTIEG
jgi:plasmid replication initiation protein